jgi:hypothetical protein
MNEGFAKLISVLFQPLLMPLAGTLIIFNLPYYQVAFLSSKAYWFIFSSTLLFTFLMPLLIIIILKRYKLIGNISMDNKDERRLPVLLTGLLFAMHYYILHQLPLPALYFSFLLSSLVTLLMCLGITYWWKISMHMAGVGGLCGALISLGIIWQTDVKLFVIMAILIAGLTGSARIKLNAHTPAQVYTGFAAGLLPQLLLALFIFH